MDSKNNERKGQATLVVMYGAVDKKQWPLNREAITLGRAHGCDIPLEAPDVSGLHCLIWRNSAGYQVRDCGSRAGTLVNGTRVQEATLHDDDILQVGPFSFRVAAPGLPGIHALSPREARLRRLERSRRNLARMALIQRRRVLETQRFLADSGSGDPDLNRKASGLRQRFRHIEQRVRRLDQAERELARDRELFDVECQDRLTRVRQSEQELARRRVELEAEFRARHEALQKDQEILEKTL
jgi:pSer/pThr/pTyr-binding forkhead associated (FHA) protein